MAARSSGAQVTIVGAGIVGAMLAYEAARRGLRVTVLERADRPAQGGSRWSTGAASWLGAAADPRLRDLAREGLDRHRMLSEELGTDSGFRPLPLVVLAEDGAALDGLAGLLEMGRAHGFSGRVVDAAELRELEPAIAPGAAAGAVVCRQGRVDTVTFSAALLAAAERLGATIRHGVEVRAIEPGPAGGAVVRTDVETVEADRAVAATGAWTRRLLRSAGLDTEVLHTHAEVLETDPLPPTLSSVVVTASQARAELERALGAPELWPRWDDHDATDALLPPAVELQVTQLDDGRVRLGQVSRGVPGFLGGPLPDGEALIRAEVARYLPALAEAPARHHGCPVSISRDRLPIAGPLPAAPGVWAVAGLAGPVIYLPALAERVARALDGAEAPELAPFAPGRFAASETPA